MREWDEREGRGIGCMGGGSGMRERGGDRAGWKGEWDEGETREQGWMDGEVG